MANAFNLTAQLNLRGPSNLKPVIKNIKSQLGNINANVNLTVAKNSSANIAKLNAGLKALNKTLNTTTVTSRNAANAISSLGTAIKGINANQVSASINKATQASQQLAAQQQTVSKSLASSRTEMEEFGKQSGLAIRRFAAFSAVTAVVFKLNNAITSGIGSFIDFQKEFIRLQQVTGDSAQALGRLESSITKLSTGLGVTSQELSRVSVTLAQAGLNARETEKALEALALSALAPSFDNLNNTVEGSIALMRQFSISSSDLGKALGSINAVAASFAVEAGDIIKAISRTGGVFANASKGVSEGTDALNEFVAVFTSVRSTTRESAETIATGLRTIFTRIQRGSTIEALKEFGVTLTDLEGKFVGPFKAIELLSQGLGRLDPRDIRFSNIVEELGGFRQIGKVIPLIQQFATAQRALGVANAGQASLAEDAAIAQLSLANQISKVREEFLALFREIGGSDSFQTIAKGALGLASALIKIADSVKGVLPVLAIVGAAKGLSAVTQFTAGFAGGIQRGGGARGFGSRLSGAPSGFAKGGLVPGQGNRDTVPAMLTPGEFVIRKKAVETIGASRLGRMNKYGRGGKVQKFADGGFIKQLQGGGVNVGAAVFESASPKTTKIPIGIEEIRKSLGIKGTRKKPAAEDLNPKIFTRALTTNISTIREGLSKETSQKFKEVLEDGLVKAVNSAGGRLSSDLGVSFTAVNKNNKEDFLRGVNDASIGNLFEDVLTGITGKYADRKPGTNFDFPKGLGPNLKDNFPSLPSQWIDAKASKKAAEPRELRKKALNEIVDEIRNNKSTYLLPINKKQQGAASAVAQPVKGKTYSLNQLKANFGVKSKKDAIEKGYSIPYDGKYEMMASGGSVKDTVPALLTPGEFVINRKAAKSLGSSKLNALNKADKLQGFNKGGPVGFADGGGVPLRPDRIRSSTVAIPDSGKEELQKLVAVLEQLGIQSSKTSEIVANQGRVSYKASIEAAKADVNRLKAAGASSTQIAEAEKVLITVRDQAEQSIKTRINAEKTFGATGKDSAAVQGRIAAEAESIAKKNIRQASKAKGDKLTSEDIAKIRDASFSKATRKVTGVSSADLKASGLSGSDLQRYISETQLDLKSQSKFLRQFEATRRQQLRQAGASAAEAKKLANQEVKARRDIARQVQKSRGLPTGGGILGRLKGMGGPQASIAASLALPMITDFFAGGEPTSAGGASTQALVQGGASAVSTGLAVGSIAGPIAGLAAGAVTLVKSFADARNAANEFAEKLSKTRIEESVEKLKAAFDDLSKNAENQRSLQLIQQELRNITTETQNLAQNNLTQTQFGLLNFTDMFSTNQDRSFQRGEVLNNQGVFAYLQSVFNPDALEDNFAKEQGRLARENAKLFVEAASSTRQYIQSLVNSGKTFEELTTDANLKDFAKNIALADLSVQQAIQNMNTIDAANFVNEVAEEELRKQIKISFNTKALEDLNKITKELSVSFKRLFSSMDQSLARVAFSLEKFDRNLDLTINSLSGSARIGESSLEDANILANPLASSDADFTRATGRAASRFGDDSGLVRGLLELGPSLEDSILKTVNSVLSTAGDNPEIAKGRISRAVQQELKNLGLPASLTTKLSREIAKAVGDITNETDKGSVSLQELTEKISGLNDLIGTSAQARKTAINALNQWQSSLNSYASAINKMTEIQLESANRLRRAASILFDAQVNLASALGKDISLDTLERERDRDIRSRTGGIDNPVDIANSLRQLETRRQSQQANLDAVSADTNAPDASAAVIKTTQELSKTNFQINETRAALESLANDSNLASAALNKIQKAQQDQAGKVTFIEKLVTSTPEQLKDLNNSFADLQRYISGQAISIQQSTAAQKAYRKALRSGASRRDAQKEAQRAFADQRGNALSLLKEISPFLGDNQQSNNLRASALETMLRESGVGMNPMLSDVLDALRNPAIDPATAKAIATYEKAIVIQSQANTQLSLLNTDLAGKIAKDSATAIKDALESVTVKFDQKQLDDLVAGIRTAAPGGKPDGKAAGGIIYASQGAAVDFAPQGTDTVPAMLTPGEFVVNRSATQKHRPILEAINNGYSKGGSVSYYAAGGYVAGSSAGADDIWKYDSTKEPVTNVPLYESFPKKEIFSGYRDLVVGHKIQKSTVEFGNNDDVGIAVPPGIPNTTLNATNNKLNSQDIPFTELAYSTAAGNNVLTGADIFFNKGVAGIQTKVNAKEYRTGATQLTFPVLDYEGIDEKKLTQKQLRTLRREYKKFLSTNRAFNRGVKTAGNFVELMAESEDILLLPKKENKAQDYDVDPPKIEAEYTPSSFFAPIETARISLSKLVSPIATPGAGIGLFSTTTNPSNYAQTLLGWNVEGNSLTANFGAGVKKRIGSSVFQTIGGTREKEPQAYIDGLESFQAQKQELDRIFGLDPAVAFTLDDTKDKQIENQLKKIFNTDSPYIRHDFAPENFKSLDKLGATNTPISVYGGGVAAFNSQFGESIDNLVKTNKIKDAQTSIGTGKPISISIAPDTKQFGWTQGISPEQLDTEFAERQEQAEKEISQIKGTDAPKKGSFDLTIPVNGNQQNVKIPYHLLYRKFDGKSKLWDPTISGFSGQTISDVFGGPGYALLPTDAALNPYATFSAGDAINLLATQDAYDSDLIIKPDFIKKQFENADVKKYLGEVLEQGKLDLGSKTAASNLMRTTLSGNNTGVGPLAFFKRINETYIDPTIDNSGLPTNAMSTSFSAYLTNVAQELLNNQKAAQNKADSQVANVDEFKSTLSHMKYLKPAFETIANTAFGLFGAGAPYNFGAQFGVPVQNLANRNQIKELSNILAGQLSAYYAYVEKGVAQGNFPNLNAYDLYNNAEVLSYGAQAVFSRIAKGDTNLISRYLRPEDLIKPNFNWQTLKDQTLTMFRAIGGSKRANRFLSGEQGRLTEDDKLDLSTLIGDKDKIGTVSSGGDLAFNPGMPELNTLQDVVELAFNPYNQFDEITDRKILINAIKARFMGATDGPNGRPLFSRQMMQNVLDSMDAVKLWFGGEPGANTDIAQPPAEFDAEGLPKGVKQNQQQQSSQTGSSVAGNVARGITAAGSFLPGLAGAGFAAAGIIGGLAASIRTAGWKGIDYLYDRDPTTPDYATRLSELQNGFDQQIYDDAQKGLAELGVLGNLGSLPPLDYYKKLSPVQYNQTGGMIYASQGQLVNFEPKGTDTVPAMLTPGEFVINKQATQKNLPLLKAINGGGVESYGANGVMYAADGTEGPVMSPAQRRAEAVQRFAKLDKNSNGVLDGDEFSILSKAYDTNLDGVLTLDEWMGYMDKANADDIKMYRTSKSRAQKFQDRENRLQYYALRRKDLAGEKDARSAYLRTRQEALDSGASIGEANAAGQQAYRNSIKAYQDSFDRDSYDRINDLPKERQEKARQARERKRMQAEEPIRYQQERRKEIEEKKANQEREKREKFEAGMAEQRKKREEADRIKREAEARQAEADKKLSDELAAKRAAEIAAQKEKEAQEDIVRRQRIDQQIEDMVAPKRDARRSAREGKVFDINTREEITTDSIGKDFLIDQEKRLGSRLDEMGNRRGRFKAMIDETLSAVGRKKDQLESDLADSIKSENENRNWFTSIANIFSGGRNPIEQSRQQIDTRGITGEKFSTNDAYNLIAQAEKESDPVKRAELLNQARNMVGLQNINSNYKVDSTQTPSRGITVGLDTKTYDTMLQSYDEQIRGAGKVSAAAAMIPLAPASVFMASSLPVMMAAGAIEGAGTAYVDAVLDDPEIKAAFGEMTPEVMTRTGLGGLLGGGLPGAVPAGAAFFRQAIGNKASKEALTELLEADIGGNLGGKISDTQIANNIQSGIDNTKQFLADIFTKPEMVDKGFDVAGKKVANAANKIIGVPSSIIKVLDELDVAQKKALLKSMGASDEVIKNLPAGSGSQAARDAFSNAFNKAANESPAGQQMIKEMIQEEQNIRNILKTAGLPQDSAEGLGVFKPSVLSTFALSPGEYIPGQTLSEASDIGAVIGNKLFQAETAVQDAGLAYLPGFLPPGASSSVARRFPSYQDDLFTNPFTGKAYPGQPGMDELFEPVSFDANAFTSPSFQTGNVIVDGKPINPNNLPESLAVQPSNMTLGASTPDPVIGSRSTASSFEASIGPFPSRGLSSVEASIGPGPVYTKPRFTVEQNKAYMGALNDGAEEEVARQIAQRFNKGGIVYAQEGQRVPGRYELPIPFQNKDETLGPRNTFTGQRIRYDSAGKEIPFSEFFPKAASREAPSQFDILNAEDRTAALDAASLGLTGAGFFPGAGNAADLAAIPVDLLRGDFKSAGLDLLSAIPIAGQGFGGLKLAMAAPAAIKGGSKLAKNTAAGANLGNYTSKSKGMSNKVKALLIGLGLLGGAGAGTAAYFGGLEKRTMESRSGGTMQDTSEVTTSREEAIRRGEVTFATPKNKGGVVYASNGALIQAQSSGSDTVPAMLTPGEFVMNRLATSQNRPLLESMNSGQFNSGGLVRYMASGGYVQPQRLQEGGGPISSQQVQSVSSGGVNNGSMERPSWVDEVLSAFNGLGPSLLEAGTNISTSAQQLASAVPSNGIDINNNVNVNGSVGLDSQSLGRAVAMGSQQGQNYADKKVGDVQSKIQSDTDGGLSFYA